MLLADNGGDLKPPVASHKPNFITNADEGACDWLIGLTERRSVGHQDVDALRYKVPFIQQRLAPRQVEPPAVKPRSPAETEEERSHHHS